MATSEAATAFDHFLDTDAPAVAGIARALRTAVLAAMPDAIESFDAPDRLLAFGVGSKLRDFWFAIIPHTAHVNLQLADGAELPNPDGRIEGTGKRVRHVKIRSVEDATSAWLRAVIQRQIAIRQPGR